MEACLLLQAAQSDQLIAHMQKELAFEIVHHNTIALQLNHLTLERAQDNLHAADKLVGHVRLTIRKSGYSATFQYVMQESDLPRRNIQINSPASEPSALDVVLD
ncbi:hypothetical protein BS17DRAFT_763730 [Gyrodon lividus]|nr:hypothetical protein BS17DRAFT_763730 [Gyrodon lividus]